ncbi:metalloregulator ArsR/SmtB family transcription factor [Tissierella sp.]|uniref:ArsR/SmtB family transcription factor n=1 Tax=Tissierella sp. TaxID=41274 RepID=UPI0028588154|nr:metalloregulator ArsR/SmtB family transcription factor [Tissierella sp.]MDR7856631.1 metalloregulator ArsR/SmtB family transcription factor [Tissierella sp.]
MSRKYNINHSPNLALEAGGFLYEMLRESEKKVIENYHSFGKKEEEMLDLFASYLEYKKVLLKEVLPIYRKYPRLEKIFQMEDEGEYDFDLGYYLIILLEQKLEKSLSKEEVDELVGECIFDMVEDFGIDLDEDTKIQSLSQTIEILEKVKLSDGNKLRVIYLYQNRYEIVEQIKKFLEEVIPSFQKHYTIIEDDYKRYVDKIERLEKLNSILDQIVNLTTLKDVEGNIRLTIFPFNRLSVRYKYDILTYSIGMYFFTLGELKDTNKTQGNGLVTDLKALGDITRLNIINRIAKRPMYIQELSDELDLTPATISHHVNILLKSELITIILDERKAKKIYYKPNERKLAELGEIITNLASENREEMDLSGSINQISIV